MNFFLTFVLLTLTVSWNFCVLNLSEIVRKYTVDKNLKYINCTAQLGSYVMTLFFFVCQLERIGLYASYHMQSEITIQPVRFAHLSLQSLIFFSFSKYFIRISQSMRRNFSWFDWKLLFWLYDKWFADTNANFVLLPLNIWYELKSAHMRVISKRLTDWIWKIELSWYSH